MTLGFSTHWPGKDRQWTLFLQKILYPFDPAIVRDHPDLLPKIHTFRLGHRWRAGMSIQMVTGNRTPKRLQFNAGIPALSTCISVQAVLIDISPTGRLLVAVGEQGIDQRYLSREETLLFAANDGFNSLEECARWFFPKGYSPTGRLLVGQIVHWTNFQY